jgi:hypothetical protein
VEPELIVLVRSKPEEAVLISCKSDNVGVLGGVAAVNGECLLTPSCFYCDTDTNS